MRTGLVRVGVFASVVIGTSTIAVAQETPIVVGGRDVSDTTGPTVCERDLGSDDPTTRWLTDLIHSLCKRGSGDSLAAAYLLSLPGFASSGGQVDDRLLHRAHARAMSDPKLSWLVIVRSECASPIPGCKAAQRAVKVAGALAAADSDNAMAWLALAYAKDQALADAAEINRALDRAAKAPRVHDYNFDLTKLVAEASADIPRASDSVDQLEEFRWEKVMTVGALSWAFFRWANGSCQVMFDEGDPDRKKFCEAAKLQFRVGDSLATLSRDSAASGEMNAVLSRASAQKESKREMLDTIAAATNERDWYRKTAARIGSGTSTSK